MISIAVKDYLESLSVVEEDIELINKSINVYMLDEVNGAKNQSLADGTIYTLGNIQRYSLFKKKNKNKKDLLERLVFVESAQVLTLVNFANEAKRETDNKEEVIENNSVNLRKSSGNVIQLNNDIKMEQGESDALVQEDDIQPQEVLPESPKKFNLPESESSIYFYIPRKEIYCIASGMSSMEVKISDEAIRRKLRAFIS